MIDEESKQRIKNLCDQIAKEQDRTRFSELVADLNQLLEELDSRPKKDGRDRPEGVSPSGSQPL